MFQTSSESILFSLVWKIRDPFAHFAFHWGYYINTAACSHSVPSPDPQWQEENVSTLILQRNSCSRWKTEQVVEFGIEHQYSNSKITFFPWNHNSFLRRHLYQRGQIPNTGWGNSTLVLSYLLTTRCSWHILFTQYLVSVLQCFQPRAEKQVAASG